MTEKEGLDEYRTVVENMATTSPPLPRQPVSESPMALYHNAAAAMAEFQELVEAFVGTVRETFQHVGFDSAPLKSLGRICEKATLKHRGSVDEVCSCRPFFQKTVVTLVIGCPQNISIR